MSPRYLLDTNVCIQVLRGKSRSIHNKLEEVPTQRITLSSITVAELAFGISLSAREGEDIKVAQFLSYFLEIPFEGAIAFEYGKIRADLQKAGTPIGQLDMMIAATALHHDLILVTRNTREFSRVKGLELEDWQI